MKANYVTFYKSGSMRVIYKKETTSISSTPGTTGGPRNEFMKQQGTNSTQSQAMNTLYYQVV